MALRPSVLLITDVTVSSYPRMLVSRQTDNQWMNLISYASSTHNVSVALTLTSAHTASTRDTMRRMNSAMGPSIVVRITCASVKRNSSKALLFYLNLIH